MNHISKHFIADNYDELILEKEDWHELIWKAFLDIFGLSEAERIVVSEYKLETWGKKEES